MAESKAIRMNKNTKDVRAMVFSRKTASKLMYKGVVMIDISISYPQIEVYGSPRVTQLISRFYRDSAKTYYEKAAHELYPAAVKEYLGSIEQHFPFRPYQVVQTFETPYNLRSLLSIYYDRYEFTGGAHGNTVRASDTWFLPAGKRLSLADFFEGSSYKSVIFEYITKEIETQLDAGSTYYFDDYVKNVFTYFDENNYYLTETGFAIYYQLYTIAAYAMGIPVFIIPYEAFGPSLKRRYFE